MAFLTYLVKSFQALAAILLGVFLYHILTWLLDAHSIRSIPGPWSAAVSDAWLGYWAVKGRRSERVHEMHQKYGTFLRIAPNHVSISDTEALHMIYGHGNGVTKSEFYDIFAGSKPSVFGTRSRSDHTRKRKILAHVFSQRHVLDFENNTRVALWKLINQWDRLCEGGAKGITGQDAEGWFGTGGKVWFDALPWYHYLTFDIIGDLALGAPFGMLDAAKDIAPVAIPAGNGGVQTIHIPAVAILNQRGSFNAAVGVLPKWVRPWIARVPFTWYSRANQAARLVVGIAVDAVEKRLADPNAAERHDLLARLQNGKDDEGNPMGKEELTTEALTQLIAGSDTTSNSLGGITFYLAKHPEIQRKLQEELDGVLGFEEGVVQYETVKRCKYLEACVNESLRLHSVLGMGLPRLVPKGGMELCGKYFKEDTVLSVPSFTIHRDPAVWGKDADVYRPERWFEGEDTAKQASFSPFSYGPRACLGQNLATLELFTTIATVIRRYDFVLENPDEALVLEEGVLRKPFSTRVGMRRRNIEN